MAKRKSDGRLRAKITVDGKAVYVQAYSKAELEQKKVEAREHLRDGIDIQRDVPFVKLLTEWWERDRKPSINTPNTLRNNLNVLNNHLLPNLDERQMARAVTRHDLQEVMDKQAGKSESIIGLCMFMLQKTCQTALTDRRIMFDPSVGLRKPEAKKNKPRGALTEDQVDRLMDAAEEAGHAGLIVYLLYFLGLRRGELLGLKWGDFDWNAGMVSIERQCVFQTKAGEHSRLAKLKTSNGYRRVPIPDQLAEVLRPFRQMPDQLVFAREGNMPYEYSDFRGEWMEIINAAGLRKISQKEAETNAKRIAEGKEPFKYSASYDAEITPHWFRHNYLTMLFDADVPAETACRLAGHAHYSTTVDIYTHIKEERLKAEAVKLDGVFTKRIGAKRLPSRDKAAR